ncbi:glycosyltransferase family 4 protein [Cellulomonas chengniuliangii]|uniref:Glycosyltransferase family 4 protein n=1 Tax=Cellulomonas chengniuliangii TaxID=2968084 RepID=A0ABY5KVN4_9CELL|nr:glycosyltransferase family 4 protein [Cellulomonas chengniuliangii]MCC2310058.1 glycosyltransferase family 4 protein [Cellulomonas chengniuliangii]UUI74547.1 glycosyltransferase family 4 protein [Cellulomonas chengniuliangii]
MKVVVVTTHVPFLRGGATIIIDWLVRALEQRGHEVDLFSLPFASDPRTMPSQMVGLRSLDFSDRCDRLIAVRTPSHLVRHPKKSVWFLHHHRPSYDMWDTARDVADDPHGREFRRMMFSSDDASLSESRVFCNSRVIQERLLRYNNLRAEVLYPPLDPDGGYPLGTAGDTIVYPARLVSHKRQLLTVEALAHTRSAVRLDLLGAFDNPLAPYRKEILGTIRALGLEERVTISPGWVDEGEKRRRISEALAVAYLPHDEDSYGYPSLEAAAMGRPVITTPDSGGVTELIEDGVNGLVVPPTPEDLGRAFDRLYEDRLMADALGAAQKQKVDALNINWDHVVTRLLA